MKILNGRQIFYFMTLNYIYYFISLYTSLSSCSSWSKKSSHCKLSTTAKSWAFLWRVVTSWFTIKSRLLTGHFLSSCVFSSLLLDSLSETWCLLLKPKWNSSAVPLVLLLQCPVYRWCLHRTSDSVCPGSSSFGSQRQGVFNNWKAFLKPKTHLFWESLPFEVCQAFFFFFFWSLNPQAFSCPSIVS